MKFFNGKRQRIPAILTVLALLLCLLPAGTALTASADSPEPESGVTLTFTESGISADGSEGGWSIDGTALTVSEAGVYTITGQCAEGSIKVKKGTAGVTLVLKDLNLACSDSAPLSCNKGTETTLYISGTVTLTDNEPLANEDSDDFDGAAVKVKSESASLLITGSGVLNIIGQCKNGIKAAATSSVTIQGGTVNVTAADNGISADGAVIISGGNVTVNSADDGIKSSPDEDDTDSLGDVTISGGTVNVTSGDDGIKAGRNLLITGGVITVSAADDALKAEYDLTVENGEINIVKSNEGIEGATVNLKGGSGTVIASDDGVNAANSDLSGYSYTLNISGGKWTINAGGDGLDSNGSLNISGGETEVYGSANNGNGALDSETGINVTGGTVLAVGMSGMAETPSSGVYVAFGGAGMGGFGGGFGGGRAGMGGDMGRFSTVNSETDTSAESFAFGGGRPGGDMGGMGGMSGQDSSISISAGNSIEIRDSDGNTLYTAEAVKSANSVIFISESLSEGASYTLFIAGSEAAAATAQSGSGRGGFGGDNMPGEPPEGDGDNRPGEPPEDGGDNRPGEPPEGDGDNRPGEPPEGDGDNRPGKPPEGDGDNRPGEPPEGDGESGIIPEDEPALPQEEAEQPSDWAREEVRSAIESNIVPESMQSGYQEPVSREKAAQMFILLLEQATGKSVDEILAERGLAIDPKAFSDTNNEYVLAANALGIIKGTGGGLFSPSTNLTRAQITAILNRTAQVLGIDTAGYTHSFTDVENHWINTELGWAVANGIIQGRGNGIFDPSTEVSTQEAIAITCRALHVLTE